MVGQKIVVLGTGGTIAGTAPSESDTLAYTAARIGVGQLVAAVPALAAAPVETEQVLQLDSKDMDAEHWLSLAARCAVHLERDEVAGVVVTHGTDTLEETAYFLHRVLAPRKPLVLTCAMRPANSVQSDGPQNLLDAVAVARSGRIVGVVAVCAGRVHGAVEVVKQHPYRLDAFCSGEGGPLAVVEEGRLRILRVLPPDSPGRREARLASLPPARDWPWVEIVTSHACADARLVDGLVRLGIGGLVVAGTGNGSVHHALEVALLRAVDQGVAVRRATRCAQGMVLPHGGDVLADSQGLSPVKARIALMLDLMADAVTTSAPLSPPAP